MVWKQLKCKLFDHFMPITICSHKNVAISCKPQNFECLCTLLKNAQPYMTVLTYNILSHSLTLGSHDLSEFYYSWLASIDWSSKLNIFSIFKYCSVDSTKLSNYYLCHRLISLSYNSFYIRTLWKANKSQVCIDFCMTKMLKNGF